jgi:hypothetical protein
MLVVEQPPEDPKTSQDEDSILVDFSDNHTLNTSSSSSNNESNSAQLQQLQQQQFAYTQQLIQEIERLRAELDRLTLEVFETIQFNSLKFFFLLFYKSYLSF